MNERIRELYLQAHSVRHYDNDPSLAGNPPTVYWQGEVSAKQFAELIVKECLLAIDKTNRHHVHTTFDEQLVEATLQKSKKAVKEHFGL